MSYQILGRAIKNEYLALGVIFSAVAGGLTMSGGKKETPAAKGKSLVEKVKEAVPIHAGSSEEEQFIKNFITEAEKGDSSH